MNKDDEAGGLIAEVISSWRNWREGRKQRGEMAGLTQEDLVEIAADCGVTPAQLIDAVRSGPHAADELAQLLRALEIDPDVVRHSNYFNDMQRVCSECGAKKRCRLSLASGIASLNYETYCPNAETLHDLEQVQNMLQPFPHS
jgi:uncharacterized protein YjiS (DUF1127 family)